MRGGRDQARRPGGGRATRALAGAGPRARPVPRRGYLRLRPPRAGRLHPVLPAHGRGRRPGPGPVRRHRVRPRVLCRGRRLRPRHVGPRCRRGPGCARSRSSSGPPGSNRSATRNAYPGALAEYMVLQEMLLVPVPDGLSTDLAALTEPMAVGEHAVGLAGLEAGQPCLVVGCGPVGLAVIAALKARGHGPVLAADFSPARRRLAEAFGADEVVDPAAGHPTDGGPTSGYPPDHRGAGRRLDDRCGRPSTPVIFEAVGVPGMLQRPDRRGAAPEPDRGRRCVHARRHHRALRRRDQGDRAALLLRVHPGRVRRHPGPVWPPECRAPTGWSPPPWTSTGRPAPSTPCAPRATRARSLSTRNERNPYP